MSRKFQLEQAYKSAIDEISNFCRSKSLVIPNLVAVSKYKPVEDIQVLYGLGHRHFGENYVQELTEKAKQLPKDIQWHFIGQLQSNKTRIARDIPNLTFVETLDSITKATKLNNQRCQIDASKLGVYIQVNTSNEEQKSGIMANDYNTVLELALHIRDQCPSLYLVGLMTIGSLEQSHQTGHNNDFSALVELRDKLQAELHQKLGLSMGMSADYIQAIQQGSTNIRIGSSIFGGRITKEEAKEQIK